MSTNNRFLALSSKITEDNNLLLQLDHLNSNIASNFNVDDVKNDYSIIYVKTDLLVTLSKINAQNYIDNIIKIFENKKYKFMGTYSLKLLFVNISIDCNDIYFYANPNHYQNHKTPDIDIQGLKNKTPFIIYRCCFSRIIEDDDNLMESYEIKNIPQTKSYAKHPYAYEFYMVTSKGQFTKAANKHK